MDFSGNCEGTERLQNIITVQQVSAFTALTVESDSRVLKSIAKGDLGWILAVTVKVLNSYKISYRHEVISAGEG